MEPEINISEQQNRQCFSGGQCLEWGECLCRRSTVPHGPASLSFHQKLVNKMRRLCYCKKKVKTPSRQLLDAGRLVLGLSAEGTCDSHEDRPSPAAVRRRLYLHLGFVNLQSWKMTVLPLYEHDPAAVESNASERVLLQTLGLCENALDGRAPQATAAEFQFSVHFFRRHIDFAALWKATLYEICEDHSCKLPEEDNKSGYVLVKKHSLPFTVWWGAAAEAEMAALHRQRRRAAGQSDLHRGRGAARGRGRGRGARPTRGRGASDSSRREIQVLSIYDEMDAASDDGGAGADDEIDVSAQEASDAEAMDALEEEMDEALFCFRSCIVYRVLSYASRARVM